MEESVAIALQSCLGGVAHNFHVLEVSQNHFHFSVLCKAVGFFVYALRRVVAKSFDVYFHLWSNGAPHWEREKRLWEEEEAKKWSTVLSKCQKRAAKSQASSAKKVRFAPQIVLVSPIKKSVPSLPRVQTICFGTFHAPIDLQALQAQSTFFDSVSTESDYAHPVQSEDADGSVQSV
jgi:hypothetical protein